MHYLELYGYGVGRRATLDTHRQVHLASGRIHLQPNLKVSSSVQEWMCLRAYICSRYCMYMFFYADGTFHSCLSWRLECNTFCRDKNTTSCSVFDFTWSTSWFSCQMSASLCRLAVVGDLRFCRSVLWHRCMLIQKVRERHSTLRDAATAVLCRTHLRLKEMGCTNVHNSEKNAFLASKQTC